MSTDYEMQAMLKKFYEQPDSPNKLGLPQGHVDIWKLENTIEDNPDDWGWQRSKCTICGERAIYFDSIAGYRCEDHQSAKEESV